MWFFFWVIQALRALLPTVFVGFLCKLTICQDFRCVIKSAALLLSSSERIAFSRRSTYIRIYICSNIYLGPHSVGAGNWTNCEAYKQPTNCELELINKMPEILIVKVFIFMTKLYQYITGEDSTSTHHPHGSLVAR